MHRKKCAKGKKYQNLFYKNITMRKGLRANVGRHWPAHGPTAAEVRPMAVCALGYYTAL